MSERDAFGREKGEDTLANMGWSSSVTPGSPIATPNPAPATATPTPIAPGRPAMSAGEPLTPGPAPAWTPGPPASYTRRRRRRARGIIVPLFIIGIFAVAIGGAVNVFRAGSDAVDRITSSIETATQSGTSTTKSTPASGTTLLQAAALKAALKKLPAGDIELLRVAPDRIDANIIVKGRMHIVQVTAGGDVRDTSTPATGSGSAVKVNSAAPGRIARTAAKRSGKRIGSVSYLVLIHLLGKDEWQLYFDDTTHFSASANGKKVHRVG
jgi:hypothetical protein